MFSMNVNLFSIHKKIKLIFCFLSLLAILGVLMSSCDTRDDLPVDTHSTNVIKQGILENGPYVYCDGSKVMRYNKYSGLLSKACMDPECDGTCPLDEHILTICQIVDNKMYFCSFKGFEHRTRYASQDLITGEVKVYVDLSEIEAGGSMRCFVYNDWMYYERYVLNDGGNIENPEDYYKNIYRVSLTSGKEEPVVKTEDESIMMAADGYIITYADGNIYAYNIDSREKNNIFNLDEYEYSLLGSTLSYLDGKIYFLCKSYSSYTSEYNKSSYMLNYLVSVDVKTGEYKKLIEDPVITFCVTDDAIYYSPMVLRHMYIPEDYENHPEGVVVFLADATLYSCALDGSNAVEVYTNDKMDYVESYTVIDGVLYGWLFDFDENNHCFTNQYFGAIDLNSGEITRAHEEN